MWALFVAAIYFGSFLAIGFAARFLTTRLMSRHGADLADVSEKALAQVKRGAVELLTPRLDQATAEALAEKLAGGHWTHDYALTAQEAASLGLPVRVGMPADVLALMKLYPQPVQRSGVEFLPIDVPTKRGM